MSSATAIEFAHRAFSGVALLVVISLFLVVRRDAATTQQARRASVWALVTIFIEALIGAGIVLFEWVADDSSVARTIAVPLHLVNTLLLLGSLAAVVALTSWADPVARRRDQRLVVWGVAAMVLVAASGAVTALADVLFPVESLAEGLAQDFGTTEAMLTRLRVVHPILAFATGLFLLRIVHRPGVDRGISDRFARAVTVLVIVQLVAGFLNIILLVPVWMQLVHLALADMLWIAFIWYGMELHSTTEHAATGALGDP